MSENSKVFIELLRTDSARREEFVSQNTMNDAYAFAVNAVPELTMDEFIAAIEECARLAEHKMSDEELEEVGGGRGFLFAFPKDKKWNTRL